MLCVFVDVYVYVRQQMGQWVGGNERACMSVCLYACIFLHFRYYFTSNSDATVKSTGT